MKPASSGVSAPTQFVARFSRRIVSSSTVVFSATSIASTPTTLSSASGTRILTLPVSTSATTTAEITSISPSSRKRPSTGWSSQSRHRVWFNTGKISAARASPFSVPVTRRSQFCGS